MKFTQTSIEGAFVVAIEPRGDERGFFARLFCADEFAAHGLEPRFVQINNSVTKTSGTLRGLHYQVAPAGEAKLVRCVHGRAYDVFVDLRASSPSFGAWFGAEITAANRLMMYVPKGCAHGFLTLDNDTEMMYLSSAPYSGAHERVLRWNDSRIGIEWPIEPTTLSDKDSNAVDFVPGHHLSGY